MSFFQNLWSKLPSVGAPADPVAEAQKKVDAAQVKVDDATKELEAAKAELSAAQQQAVPMPSSGGRKKTRRGGKKRSKRDRTGRKSSRS